MWRLFVLLGWLCVSWAQAAPLAPLALMDAPSQSLSGHMELLRDPGGRLDVQAAAQGAFTPISGDLIQGYITDVVWLRFSLTRREGVPATRMLEVEPAFLDDLRLYSRLPDGTFREQRSGAQWPMAQRDFAWRNALFALPLDAPGEHEFLLRVTSRSTIWARLTVWSPAAFIEAATHESLLRGMYFGLSLMIVVFYMAFWRWTREATHGLYALYVAGLTLVTAFNSGWVHQFLPDFPPDTVGTTRGLVLCFSGLMNHHFNMVFLRARARAPRFRRGYLACANGVTLAAALLLLTGRNWLAMPGLYAATLMLWLAVLGLAIRLAWRGDRPARLFILGFTPILLGASLYLLNNIGVLPSSFWVDNGYAIGSLAHIVLMSLLIFSSYEQLKRAKVAAESQARAEHAAREEQREFMSMVSHEFRTPLAIADTTLENLRTSPALGEKDVRRVDTVRRATQRLAWLMESYLAADRITSTDHELRRDACDLAELCAAASRELAEQPGPAIELDLPPSLPCVCDRDLIRIAVRNLLENARRHSPPDRPISLHASAGADGVKVLVRDTGEGIPADELPKIFGRYFRGRTARRHAGTGLGLHLVATIVGRHGGHVDVKSVPGEGAEFSFVLPHGVR